MRMSIYSWAAGISGLFAVGCVAAPAPAYAGGWQFHPERCPDLVEDVRDRRESRRDERYDRGPRDVIEDRRDRRESRRDESVTVCPASAWVWHGDRGARRAARPVASTVYYNPYKNYYYRYGPNRKQIRIVVR